MEGQGPGTPAVPSPPLPCPLGWAFWGCEFTMLCVPCPAGMPSAPSRHQLSPQGLMSRHQGLQAVTPHSQVAVTSVTHGSVPAMPSLTSHSTYMAMAGGQGGNSRAGSQGAAAGSGVPLSPVPSALSCLLPRPCNGDADGLGASVLCSSPPPPLIGLFPVPAYSPRRATVQPLAVLHCPAAQRAVGRGNRGDLGHHLPTDTHPPPPQGDIPGSEDPPHWSRVAEGLWLCPRGGGPCSRTPQRVARPLSLASRGLDCPRQGAWFGHADA